jgi:deazaflavin-dependent oxidoreductase (nitroreductase family)
VALVETHGRVTGRLARAAVGFAVESDGSLLVAAGDPEADWALNLLADPSCRVTIGDATVMADALELDGPDRGRAIRELILKYGTPSERLGLGPVFRLIPVAVDSETA